MGAGIASQFIKVITGRNGVFRRDVQRQHGLFGELQGSGAVGRDDVSVPHRRLPQVLVFPRVRVFSPLLQVIQVVAGVTDLIQDAQRSKKSGRVADAPHDFFSFQGMADQGGDFPCGLGSPRHAPDENQTFKILGSGRQVVIGQQGKTSYGGNRGRGQRNGFHREFVRPRTLVHDAR